MSSGIDLYSVISEANAQKKASNSKPNGVIIVLDSMNESDRSSLLKALNDPSIDSTVIHDVLKSNGYEVSYDQVRRFRRGDCHIPDTYSPSGGE